MAAAGRRMALTPNLVAGAAGHWASCAEYLMQTFAHLERAEHPRPQPVAPASHGPGEDRGCMRVGRRPSRLGEDGMEPGE
jgi:hypothetical protein